MSAATITGLLLPADGTLPRFVQTPAADYPAIAKAIGCQFVEYVNTVIPGVVMLVDEEGAIRPDGFRVLNLQASGRLHRGHIFGDVIVYSETEVEYILEAGTLTPEHFLAVCDRLDIRHVLGVEQVDIEAWDGEVVSTTMRPVAVAVADLADAPTKGIEVTVQEVTECTYTLDADELPAGWHQMSEEVRTDWLTRRWADSDKWATSATVTERELSYRPIDVDEPTEDLGQEPGLHRLIERGEA